MLSRLWGGVKTVLSRVFTKEAILAFLKEKLVKLALKKIFGTALKAASFKVWLVTFILTHLYEDLGEPVVKAGIRKVGYAYDYVDGTVVLKKIEGAENADDWRNSIGNA